MCMAGKMFIGRVSKEFCTTIGIFEHVTFYIRDSHFLNLEAKHFIQELAGWTRKQPIEEILQITAR